MLRRMRRLHTSRRWRVPVAAVIIIALMATLILSIQPVGMAPAEAAGATYYVSKTGNNADGRSWATAWNELNQINWTVIQPGDTVLVDGGSSSMTYNSTLTLGKSGVADSPITIRLASEAGRNGRAVIFGGRGTALPYCGQASYSYNSSARAYGVDTAGKAWLVVDGTKWRGIAIHGHNKWGVNISGGSSNVVVRNVEVYDNGWAYQSNGLWYPDGRGISPSGTNNTVDRAIIYDNGQDALQSSGGISNFTLRNSWLYMARKAPDGRFWNYCRHPDGIQVFGGGEQYGITIESSVIGPGFMQGLLLGAGMHTDHNGNPRFATIHNVAIRNTLFYGNGNINVSTNIDPYIKPRNWVIENVTSDRPTDQKWHNIHFVGDANQMAIRNSIFTGGWSMSVPSGAYSGNFQYWIPYGSVGTATDPQYANPAAHGSTATNADFALAAGSPAAGKGASVTSAAALLAQSTTSLSPPPSPTPTATPGASAGLAWEAEAGAIASPFSVSNGYVSQSVETTNPSMGGRASYKFNITTPGNYVVKALLSAPNAAADSVFINIDGEPTNPGMIWDTGVTSGFQERTASWRGSGTVDANQYSPKVFSLSAGTHELIIRGREKDVRMDSIRIEAVAATQAMPSSTPTSIPTATAAPPTATATPASVVLTGLAWEAEAGAIASPFSVSNGYVSQSVETTNPSMGGRASYKFNITTPGNYVVKALLSAPNAAADSVFINIDGEPTNPGMIWDTGVTSGFQERTASWRGSGTVDANQYSPKVFSLSAGTHELIIRGREMNLRFDRISVEAVATATPAPTNTTVPSPTPTATTVLPTATATPPPPTPTATAVPPTPTATPTPTAAPSNSRGGKKG